MIILEEGFERKIKGRGKSWFTSTDLTKGDIEKANIGWMFNIEQGERGVVSGDHEKNIKEYEFFQRVKKLC